MAIKLTCPSCLREAKLVNSFWGKDYKCKGCGDRFRVSREVVDGFAHSKKEPPAKYAKCPGCVQAVLVIDGACPLCQTSIDSNAKRIRLTSDSSPASDVSRPSPRAARPTGPPQEQVMEHTRPLNIEEVPAIPGMSNRNLILIGCALVFLIIGTTVVMTVFNRRRKAEIKQAELLPMKQDLDRRIAQSEHLAAEFEYDQALAFLTPIEDRVVSNMNDELVDKYWVAVGKVRKAKVDYEIKTGKGYVVFDGKLVTKPERKQMVARKEQERRNAEARRKAIEARRKAEEERRQEEERRRQEQARLEAANALRETAYQMSHEFVKKQLKSPSSARFPPFNSTDVSVSYDMNKGTYTVRAWVEAQNPFGVYLRGPYVCVLWPTSGDYWRSSSTILY